MKRILALVLTLAMALSVCLLAGCGDTPADPTTTASSTPAQTTGKTETTTADGTPVASTPADTTTASDTTKAGSTDPEDTTTPEDTNPIGGGTSLEGFDGYTKLPGYEDIDFGGRTFVICGGIETTDVMNTDQEIYSDETDAIHTAVRERNLLVERLYNCNIKLLAVETPGAQASADVTGNQHTIDIYSAMYIASSAYTGDQIYNLYNLGINFENPWWDQNFVDTFTFDVNGIPTMYTAIGDFSLTANDSVYVLFYNKDVYESSPVCNQYDIYQLVRDKKWTMDIFMEMAKDVKRDANGDSSYNYADGDILGWIRTGHATHALHVASNMRIVNNVDGKFVFSPSSEVTAWSNVIDKAINVWNAEGNQTISYSNIAPTIVADQTLFASEILGAAERCKDDDVSLALVPYPLYDETQVSYANYVDNHKCDYMIPISVPDPETVATFFELYTCHSKYTVRNAFIETFKVEYFCDEESGEMLDLILDNRTYDPGYLWWPAYETDIGNMISSGKNTVTQWVGKKGAGLTQKFDEFFTGLYDNKN